MGTKPRKPAGPPKLKIDGREVDETLLEECEAAIEKLMEQQVDVGDSFETYEQALTKIVHEIARRQLEKKLQSISDGFARRLAIDHNEDWHGRRDETVATYRRHCPGVVTYHSLFGAVRVLRYTYRERGFLSTLVPLDLAAGLMEHMTPALARCVAIGYAHMPLRVCEELLIAGGLQPPSRSTLDRTARDLGAYATACNPEIEPLVRANERLPVGTCTLVVGLDRVAVPMRHGEEMEGVFAYSPDLRRSRPTPKPRDALRGPVQWRMDYVGTVAFIDRKGQLLKARKYRVPANADIAKLVERVMADVRHALVQAPIAIAVVQDGAPELWTAITNALRAEPMVPPWTEVLDWYHLDERLTKCLDISARPTDRERQRQRWHAALLEKSHGAHSVLRSLRKTCERSPDAEAEELGVHLGYIERNQHRMKYCEYRKQSIPIGSGVTEGACKSVVNVRAKRSGQRWSQRGLTAVLHLRAMHESDRFDTFWSFFARRYRAKTIIDIGGGQFAN